MRFLFFVFSLILSFSSSASLKSDVKKLLKSKDFYSRTNRDYLIKGKTLARSKASDYKVVKDGKDVKMQKMHTKVLALHSLGCEPFLQRFSNYEGYKDYFDFIKVSKYENGHALMNLKMSLVAINFDVPIDIKIDRATQEKKYDFIMDVSDMIGTIGLLEISKMEDRCLVSIDMKYDGPHSGYWNSILETALTHVATLGIDRLFKLSGHKLE